MAGKNDTITNEHDAGEKTTKERIFEVSLDLFSRKGFDAVSMREIAEAVGIKKASLYSHFTSKEELLEKVLEYPVAGINALMPDPDIEHAILSLGVEGFMEMTTGIFNKWMEAPGMEKIWRLLCIEIYHNERIQKFFIDQFLTDAMSFWTSNFSIMMKHKLIKECDPEVLAREYMSFYVFSFFRYFFTSYGKGTGTILDIEGKNIREHMNFLVSSIKA